MYVCMYVCMYDGKEMGYLMYSELDTSGLMQTLCYDSCIP